MTYYEICDYETVNATEDEKVMELAASMLKNGWNENNCPILTYGNVLITGSHRLTALRYIASNDLDEENIVLGNKEIAYDVTSIIEEYLEEHGEEELWNNTDCLREIFEGTWVEEYKDELEW